MDSECTAANVQPLVDDGTAPSVAVSQTARRRRASEARERRLERERARRRQCLASETAEERERRLSQRRARDRAPRAVRASSTSAEERLSQRRARDSIANASNEHVTQAVVKGIKHLDVFRACYSCTGKVAETSKVLGDCTRCGVTQQIETCKLRFHARVDLVIL